MDKEIENKFKEMENRLDLLEQKPSKNTKVVENDFEEKILQLKLMT